MNAPQQGSLLTYGNIDASQTKDAFSRELRKFLEPLSPEEQAKKLEIFNSREELESYVAFFGSDITEEEKRELLQFLVGDVDNLSVELDGKFLAFLYLTASHQVTEINKDFSKSMRMERVLVWLPDSIRDRARNLLRRFV